MAVLRKEVFPFCPGIEWGIRMGKVECKMPDRVQYDEALSGRDPVVCCPGGGLLEAYFSCCYLEMYRRAGKENIKYIGPYKEVIEMNGIAKVVDYKIDYSSYPAPLFMDRGNGIYNNVMFDYLGTGGKRHRLLMKDLWMNALVPWDNVYFPRLRRTYGRYDDWEKANKFSGRKYVMIFPHTYGSLHKNDFLGWGEAEIKELASILRPRGIDVLVVNNFGIRATGGRFFRVSMDLDIVLNLMKRSLAILSFDIDFLVIGALMKKLVFYKRAKYRPQVYDMKYNNNYFYIGSVYYEKETLNPVDIAEAVIA